MVIKQQQWEWFKNGYSVSVAPFTALLDVSSVCLMKSGLLEIGSSEYIPHLFCLICVLNIYLLWSYMCGLVNRKIFGDRHHCSHPYSFYSYQLLDDEPQKSHLPPALSKSKKYIFHH